MGVVFHDLTLGPGGTIAFVQPLSSPYRLDVLVSHSSVGWFTQEAAIPGVRGPASPPLYLHVVLLESLVLLVSYSFLVGHPFSIAT